MKAATPCIQLSPQDKRVLNVLQLKIYDLSQNVEILGKQLSSNQIKDVVASTFNIFCQLRRIFENSGTPHLYEIFRKMQVNSVVLISILTDRIDKKITEPVKLESQERKPQTPKKTQKIQDDQLPERKVNPAKLGGINLYNQSYARGLQYFQVADADSLQQMAGKCRIKQSKKLKEQFMNTISRQLELKAEVEMENASDEIKKYIKEYKENSKINSYISYEKELIEIIDFFKVSELQAMNFLNKSPNNQDYTEDFINRINDLQKDFKLKEKSQKRSINQKLKEFILKLRQRIHETQRKYQEKAAKLALYEKSLKKETNNVSTQTFDAYEFRLKEQQQTIKELQERYKILSEIKNKELSFQSQYYQIHHELNIKVTQVNKIKTINMELQEEIDYLKKIIRQNKEKINVDLKDFERRKNKNKKIIIEPSKKQLERPDGDNKSDTNTQWVQGMEHRASKLQRKTKRMERINSQTSAYLKTVELSEVQSQLAKEMLQQQQISKQSTETPKKAIYAQQNMSKQESKQSFFKNEYKKNSNKLSDQERKVFFIEGPLKTKQRLIKQVSQSKQSTLVNVSIQNINNEEISDEVTLRSSRKNIFKMAADVAGCSIKSLDQNKKSNKSTSRKCIIMKDSNEKSVLATAIKFYNLTISHEVVNLTVYPEERCDLAYSKQPSKIPIPSYLRGQRTSYQFVHINPQQLNSSQPPSNQQFSEISQMTNKGRTSNISLSTKQKLKALYSSEKSPQVVNLKTENNRSKKQLNLHLNLNSSKHPQNKGPINTANDAVSPKLQDISYKKLNKIDRPKAHLDRHRKDIATYLDKINNKYRDVSLSENDGGSSFSKWKGEAFDNSDSNTIADYIIEQLTKEQLDIDQFKQIAQILQEEDDKIESSQDFNSGKKGSKAIVPIFKQLQAKPIKKQGLIKEKSFAKKKQNRQPIEPEGIKEEKVQIFGIGQHIYLKIRQIHRQLGNCSNKDGNPCQHLIKYLTILKKINQLGSQKCPLKMHIEKIGQIRDRPFEDPKCFERLSEQQKFNRSSYARANMATLDQQIEQQHKRILPVISNTTSTYYKSKTRPFLNNRQ